MSGTLVVLAAGIGRRFGGTKQLESVGAQGEAFLDLTIAEAAAGGIERAVLVVRTDLEQVVTAHLDEHPPPVPHQLVFQDTFGPARTRPWGTVHAVLTAGPAFDGPFVVANADDHYGATSHRLAAQALTQVGPDRAALVAFELDRTVPVTGRVSRGVCEVDDGRLVGVREHRRIERSGGSGGAGRAIVSEHGELAPDTPVSMNLWCFDHAILDGLGERWQRFLDDDPGQEAECFLPDAVAELVGEGLTVEVIATPDRWIGVTNPADLETARRHLAEDRPGPPAGGDEA